MIARMKLSQFISSPLLTPESLVEPTQIPKARTGPDKQKHACLCFMGSKLPFFCMKVKPNVWPSTHIVDTNRGSDRSGLPSGLCSSPDVYS